MYLLLFVILILKCLNTYARGDEEKYIDLLPEEEKQAFLDKVTRRLVSGIKTKESKYKSSVELSDDELNQHSSYVSQIVDEESKNLRRNIDDRIDNGDSNELKVKGVDIKPLASDLEDQHIDLTLRKENKRNWDRKSGHNLNKNYTAVPVQTIYDFGLDKPRDKNNAEEEGVVRHVLSGENSTIEDIQVRGPRKSKRDSNVFHLRRKGIARGFTKIDNYEPEEVTENQKDSDDEVESTPIFGDSDNLNVNVEHNSYTAGIPYEPIESENNSNGSDDLEDTTINLTTDSNNPKKILLTTDSPFVTDKYLSTNVATTAETLTTVAPDTTTVVSMLAEQTTKSNSEIVTSTGSILYLRANNDFVKLSVNDSFEQITENVPTHHTGNDKSETAIESSNNITFGAQKDVREIESLTITLLPEIESVTKNYAEDKLEVWNSNNKEWVTTIQQGENFENAQAKNGLDKRKKREDGANNDEIKKILLHNRGFLDAQETEHNLKNDINKEDHPQVSESGANSKNVSHDEKYSTSKYIETHKNNFKPELENNYRLNENVEDAVVGLSKHDDNLESRHNVENEIDKNVTVIESDGANRDNLKADNNNEAEPHDVGLHVRQNTDDKELRGHMNKSKENNITEKNGSVNFNYTNYDKHDIEKSHRNSKKTQQVSENNAVVSNHFEKTDNNTSGTNEKLGNVSKRTPKIYSASIRSKDDVTVNSHTNNTFVLTTTKEYLLTSKKPIARTSNETSLNDTLAEAKEINLVKTNSTGLVNPGPNKTNAGSNDLKIELDESKYLKDKINLQNTLKSLRQELTTNVEPNNGKKSTPKKTLEEYVVYEIPAGQTPFIKSKPLKISNNKRDENKEQPYFVPIYNYSSNNAYYDPYNRLGPNVDDKLSDIESKPMHSKETTEELVDIGSSKAQHESNNMKDPILRTFKYSGYNDENYIKNSKPYFKSAKDQTTFNFPLPLILKRPKVTKFIEQDYQDMDYYGGSDTYPNLRSRKENKYSKSMAPDFREDFYPYGMMNSATAKDHLSAVRQMMYMQNHFGFVPDIEKDSELPIELLEVQEIDESKKKKKLKKKKFRTSDTKDVIILLPNNNLRNKHDRKATADEISVDYYFGIDSEEGSNVNNKLARSSATIKILKDIKNDSIDISRILGELRRRYAKKNVGQLTKEKQWRNSAGSIKDLLLVSDSTDVFPNLGKMDSMLMKYTRAGNSDDRDLDIFMNVLKDMIELDNKALVQYDWLGTTVDVLGALQKLQYLVDSEKNSEIVHPLDKELLKYVMYLYKLAKPTPDEDYEILRKPKPNRLPRNNKRAKEYLKAKGLLDRVWLYIRERLNLQQHEYMAELYDFGDFLDELQSGLYDLYNALKHIAMVSKYNKQMWFTNLKQIYLKKLEKKNILEVLLHFFTNRLFSLIEESAVNGIEDDYGKYLQSNYKHIQRSIEEMSFVLKLLKRYKDLDVGKNSC